MNAVFLLCILGLVFPVYCQETQVTKKQDKRGLIGLEYGAYGHGGLQNNVAVGTSFSGYGHGYLGVAATYPVTHGVAAPAFSHGYSAPIISHGYNSPLHPSYRLGYSASGLGHAGLGYGNLAHGAGVAYGTGLGFGAGSGYGVAHAGSLGTGFGVGAGYGHGW